MLASTPNPSLYFSIQEKPGLTWENPGRGPPGTPIQRCRPQGFPRWLISCRGVLYAVGGLAGWGLLGLAVRGLGMDSPSCPKHSANILFIKITYKTSQKHYLTSNSTHSKTMASFFLFLFRISEWKRNHQRIFIISKSLTLENRIRNHVILPQIICL